MEKSHSNPHKPAPWFYWASTALAVIAFVGSGLANLFHAKHVMVDMARLGYPPYFSTILGAWKVAGALTIAAPSFPRLKEWAYAGMVFDLSGAALSRFAMQDPPMTIVGPLVVLSLVFLSWQTRPTARKSRAFAWTERPLAARMEGY